MAHGKGKKSTAYISQIVSTCLYNDPTPAEIVQILGLVSETIPALLGRGFSVTIKNLGTFTVTSKGYIKFIASSYMKTQTRLIREKTGTRIARDSRQLKEVRKLEDPDIHNGPGMRYRGTGKRKDIPQAEDIPD